MNNRRVLHGPDVREAVVQALDVVPGPVTTFDLVKLVAIHLQDDRVSYSHVTYALQHLTREGRVMQVGEQRGRLTWALAASVDCAPDQMGSNR